MHVGKGHQYSWHIVYMYNPDALSAKMESETDSLLDSDNFRSFIHKS